jgi:hypothetical protein
MKSLIQKSLNRIGWEIVRLGSKVPRDLFDSITTAYEYEISKSRVSIQQKSRRTLLLGELVGTSPPEAFFIIESVARTNNLGGDVCEFGVAQGRTSALLANELLGTGRVLHLFDSFSGLPAPSNNDKLIDDIFSLGSLDAYEGLMSFPPKAVEKILDRLEIPRSSYVIHPGFIADSLKRSKSLPNRVTFAYIDFDFYDGIFDALTFVDKTSSIGTEIIVDDYDYFSSGAKLAVEHFLDAATLGKWKCEVADRVYGHFATLIREK